MDQFYIGVDFHPHQQTVVWCERETGEIKTVTLKHDHVVIRAFYAALPPGVVGIEATTPADWFAALVRETGHELWVGNPAKIRARARSRHKSDRRDAELLYDLLRTGEFPRLWRREHTSQQVLDILHLRHRLVRQRTQVYNRLQALAHRGGLPKGRVKTPSFQTTLKACVVDDAQAIVRTQWFNLLEQLDTQIAELELWLHKQTKGDAAVQRLLTQKGVGELTALTVVHTLGDVQRFPRLGKQIVAFAGLDPLERSSAGKTRFAGISKQGSALLRFQLGQAANIAARYEGKLKSHFKKLAKKKPRAVAKTATARKLLVKLAIMLRDEITAAEFEDRGRTVGNARGSARSEMTLD